ncbi:MAG: hydrogenase accessory protein HypB, partial [Campylobacterota bacterium]|nr:hydrogenase accessory protein HypB [Campylobacterota bacterium]
MCQDCGCSLTEHSHEEHHHHHDDKLANVHANPQLNDKKTVDVIKKILD